MQPKALSSHSPAGAEPAGQPGLRANGQSPRPIRLLVVDSNRLVCQALATRLGVFTDLEVAGTAASIDEALALAPTLRPDVVLLDLKDRAVRRIGRGPSFELRPDHVGRLFEALAGHRAGIIVLTSYADEVDREAALRAGASRYLLKYIDSARLVREIEAVAAEAAGRPT
ncbi:MAG: response regulator transcription factor [Chloroflexi bacterium]|nr:response regulator transcription factor [Chloroflexota bacterium]MCI0577096.1 response regulator transcription factor [Chloroflexota bacterium]MCI0643766.1 response regulator transcription factor [Chloroflexota bacterium]MCI0731582.1 response regulator transcription factor [Chloroflexota bacterium]